ncbi:regulator of (H+)-ATPase in vacuolar membrane [Knufia obscura]|uniref:Regulator of (H+)-ATPase in vacuolar membrane n=1 Tax=Knufia obscura TaxID=1635080 RepID=A0ABR0RHX6_9EURO|nr:regulator of (H+)-ATPase in vacuolar membrane [Knufia obscura]
MRSILPGRPQPSRQALSTVNWDGLRVVAYVSGNTVIVFNGRREILQSIVVDDADDLFAVTIEEETGQIATCDNNAVYVYQPLGRDYGDLRWNRVYTLTTEDEATIAYISWGSANDLLVGGQRLTLWSLAAEENPQAIWSSDLSTPVSVACFSPDAGLIASCGIHDRIVKIWRRLSYEQDSTRFDVSYLPHPSTVTSLSWRRSWHQEQNLENLLYTTCSDNQIRVWAHSDHHAYTTLQKIATIDANMSIQPRRLSMGSVSKSRTSFIIASRDLARAAERALQTYRQGTDHALEHLVEIANRAPEVCVILDGLGHMSSWGIENAGLKNKLPAEKFNLALVDGVDFALPSENDIDDYAQIHAFANNDISASLCILVHSFSGQIDWYQGSFVDFFDTAAKPQRTRHVACWSGHDSAVDRMVSASDSRSFLSLTDEEQVILWTQTKTDALVRSSEAQAESAVLDAVLLNRHDIAVLLHSHAVSLWDLRSMKALLLSRQALDQANPKCLQQLPSGFPDSPKRHILVLFENGHVERYDIYLPGTSTSAEPNGYHKPLACTRQFHFAELQKDDWVELCAVPKTPFIGDLGCMFSRSESGLVQVFGTSVKDENGSLSLKSRLATRVRVSNIVSCLYGRLLALTHADCRTMSIWDVDQGSCEFVHTFSDLDSIQELYWHTMHDGFVMLAVQFAYNIVVVGQRRYAMDTDVLPWKLQQIIPTRRHSSHVIGSLCWLEPCQIAVGLGNQILTFDVEDSRDDAGASGPDKQSNHDTSTLMQLRLRNSTLPAFNPEILGKLLQVGHYPSALAILESLYNELRFLTQGEAISLDDESYFGGLMRKPQQKVLTNGHVQSSEQDSETQFELEDAQSLIGKNVSNIASWQLPVSQHKDLQGLLGVTVELMKEQMSLDPASLTYVYHFLRALGKPDPSKPHIEPLPYAAIVHASLSNTQEALLHFIDSHLEERNTKFTWATAKSLGVFLWISDLEILKTYFESVARAEYNRNSDDRNPVDCSLYYLALDKKAILQSLWRRTVGVRERENTLKLLAHDFREQRWKSTALKNAYALLSRRRFEYAAAFFLLGGALGDAVNVCVNQLHDVQLAIAITRVWQGDSAVQEKVMSGLSGQSVLDLAVDTHEARWLATWACTYRQDWVQALQYIVKPIDVLLATQFENRRASESDEQKKLNMPFEAMSYHANEPTLLINMYKQLRTKLVTAGQWTEEVITPKQEWNFVMRCVSWYTRAGMDLLALQLVATWEFVEWQDVKVQEESASVVEQHVPSSMEAGQKSALDDWLMPDEAAIMKDVTTAEKDKDKDEKPKAKPPPTQFTEPSADSLLDSFGF